MYPTLRRLLFRLDAERAHDLVLGALARAGASAAALRLLELAYGVSDPRLEVRRFGLRFPNPVGLAAGLDKDGEATGALAALGFGFLELGTVTALAQPGNPRPRLSRLVQDEALVNRMGFNNAGAEALAARLAAVRAKAPPRVPLGVNVGKSRAAALESAADDYELALRAVWPVADYVALNVSSPNTPGLRALQEAPALRRLLEASLRVRDEMGPKPILLKIAPDLDEARLDAIVAAAERHGVDGLIATNTTVERHGLRSPGAAEPGGLSGRPLRARSLAVLRMLRERTALPVVSVGGIAEPEDVLERLRAGACLVQLYTSFIYRGPALLRRVARGLGLALDEAGAANLDGLIPRH